MTGACRGKAPPALGVMDELATLAPIGLIGGMSWRSTVLYYERLNRAIDEQCAQHCSARVVVASLDYASLLKAAAAGRWDQVEQVLVRTGQWLEEAGCKIIVLTAVTAHLSHAAVENALRASVPHVLDATAAYLDLARVGRIGVLGTARTCGSRFIRERLATATERKILVPEPPLQDQIDRMIHERLSHGVITDADRSLLQEAVIALSNDGAEAVLLACTELPLLLPLEGAGAKSPLVIDTVQLHVQAICRQVIEARAS